jgi:hypothetical protein
LEKPGYCPLNSASVHCKAAPDYQRVHLSDKKPGF